MITHDALRELAAEWGLREDVIEKDYVIGWVLWGIGSQPEIMDGWVFKGGTSLKKCFMETWRFSEDLDFTILPESPIEPDGLLPIFQTLLDRVHDASGIDFTVRPHAFRIRAPGSIEGSVYYRGPRGAPTPARLKLDLLGNEKMARTPMRRPIAHPYSGTGEDFPADATALCYSFEEVFAEKIRAMGERCRPRDLYDIVNLSRHCNGLSLRPEDIHGALVEKCRSKGVPLTTYGLIDSSPYKQELISEWENMLGHQLPALPNFEHFWNELPGLFKWLETREVRSMPAAIGTGHRETRTEWIPPASLSSWGAGFSMEAIRFAAFNHLCVELGYVKENGEFNRYLIEPYSLYRTTEGNLVLRAVRSDNKEPRSFRVDRIRSAKPSDKSFTPTYAIEMFEKGPVTGGSFSSSRPVFRSPASRPASARAHSAPRRRSANFSGVKYVYQCPMCQKKFTRSSMDSTLNPHKGAYGTPCSGRTGWLVDTKY